jgi:hypothetical protein
MVPVARKARSASRLRQKSEWPRTVDGGEDAATNLHLKALRNACDWPEQATDGLAPIQGLRFQNIFPPRPRRLDALFGIPHVLSPRQNEHSPSKATVRQSSTAFSPSSKYAPSDRPINRELSGHNQPGWQFPQCGILFGEEVGVSSARPNVPCRIDMQPHFGPTVAALLRRCFEAFERPLVPVTCWRRAASDCTRALPAATSDCPR